MRSVTYAIALGLVGLLAGCSSDPGAAPALEVDVFGWTADDGFTRGLPPFEDAQTVRVKITQPTAGEVVMSETFASNEGTGRFPEVPFGDDLRLDFEVLNSQGGIIASGATPTFDFSPDREPPVLAVRLQVVGANEFAPVGNEVRDRETDERRLARSKFDYRGQDVTWLGRTGHATARTSDGKILVVGGGDPVPGSGARALPEFRSIYDDIQVFDPKTGYFTNLAYDEDERALLADGKDALFEPIVFHSLTPIGDDRFLVVGGFTRRSDTMRSVNTIQIIDLNAPVGTRVQRLVDSDGSSLVLQKARGWHTATYRSIDQHVVVAGGIGPQGVDDVLSTFEMIDLASSAVYREAFPMREARARHEAVLMADGRTIWVLGGRDADGAARKSTEVIRLKESGTTESADEANMRTGRYDFGAVRVSPNEGKLILVAGGFTDADGSVDDSYEISGLGRGSFATGSDWTLSQGRGGLRILELPQSHDVIAIGGRTEEGETIGTADRLTFQSLTADLPYVTDETAEAVMPRYRPSADLLTTGQILLVGGEGEFDDSEAGLDSADLFNPVDPVGGTDVVVID